MEKIDKDCLALILAIIHHALMLRNEAPLHINVNVSSDPKEEETYITICYCDNQISYNDNLTIGWDDDQHALKECLDQIAKTKAKIQKLKNL